MWREFSGLHVVEITGLRQVKLPEVHGAAEGREVHVVAKGLKSESEEIENKYGVRPNYERCAQRMARERRLH
jgi:hypothetical protein